jgi:hypothetical protein
MQANELCNEIVILFLKFAIILFLVVDTFPLLWLILMNTLPATYRLYCGFVALVVSSFFWSTIITNCFEQREEASHPNDNIIQLSFDDRTNHFDVKEYDLDLMNTATRRKYLHCTLLSKTVVDESRNTSSETPVSSGTTYGSFEDTEVGHCAVLCAICLEEYEVGDEVSSSRNPQCLHVFHKDCVAEWLMKQTKCPVCRRKFVGSDYGYRGRDLLCV